jgi:endonuclease G
VTRRAIDRERSPWLRLFSASVTIAAVLFGVVAAQGGPGCAVDPPTPRPTPAAAAPARAANSARPDQTPRPARPPPTSPHLALGAPVGRDAADELVLEKPQYVVGYSRARRAASWVSYRLVASDFGAVPRYRGKFLADDALPAGVYRARHEDYSGSGYDRGHLVRSEERTRTPEDNRATFLLTNVLPQTHELNAGPWLHLEQLCEALAKGGRELHIVAGGLFDSRPPTIGEGVAVPRSFFKIVVALERGEHASDVTASTRVIAVVMPNTTDVRASFGEYRTTVDDLEQRAAYDFLPRLPDEVERALEARRDAGPTRAE